jgi:hypothetical protein
MLITISIYKEYLPSSPTTAKFEAYPATNRNEYKLHTYCTFKFIFQQEKYLDNIKELSNRSTLARFRKSAHKLEIERGRYTM